MDWVFIFFSGVFVVVAIPFILLIYEITCRARERTPEEVLEALREANRHNKERT